MKLDVDSEDRASLAIQLTCNPKSFGTVWVRDASETLLRPSEGEASAVGGGEVGREYRCVTGRRRRDGSRPAGCEIYLQVGRHGGYAVARTAPAAGLAVLEPRVFWKSTSCAKAISMA